MPRRNWLISLLAVAGVWSAVQPAMGQALLPYTLNLDADQLEQDGVDLAQDAAQLIRFGQYDLAFPRAKLSTQLAPEAYQTWFILGSLYVQRDEVEQGIEVLEKARSLAPDEPGILFTLGSAYFQQKDYQSAIAQIQAGLKLEPEAPEALFDLGNAYLMTKRYGQAIDSFQKAVSYRKDFWPAINNIGLVQYEQGKVNEAIEKWQTAAEIDPDAAEPQLATAVALYQQGQRQQGISLGEAALTMDNRYADLEFLRENLWGEKLLQDTQQFFTIPQIQAGVARPAETTPNE